MESVVVFVFVFVLFVVIVAAVAVALGVAFAPVVAAVVVAAVVFVAMGCYSFDFRQRMFTRITIPAILSASLTGISAPSVDVAGGADVIASMTVTTNRKP